MDRTIIYPGSIPLAEDLLQIQRSTLEAFGAMAFALTGGASAVDGLAASAPGGLAVNVAPGFVYATTVVDGSAFSVLPPQLSGVVKVGANPGQTFPLSAPTGAGTSIAYLVEAAFNEFDADPAVLSYYNAANPAQPFSGPANSGAAQYTRRFGRCVLQLKAGAVAPTGTEVAPAADLGWLPLYVVRVNAGSLSVAQGSISEHPQAPFLRRRLTRADDILTGFATHEEVISAANAVAAAAAAATNAAAQAAAAALAVEANLRAAIRPGRPDILVFDVPGSIGWTVPAGVYTAKVRMVGGGGGGSACDPQTDGRLLSGSGGGAGGYVEMSVPLTPGDQHAVLVGAGGAGGTAGAAFANVNGSAGGTSAFGTFGTATGGGGGDWTNAYSSSAGGMGGNGNSAGALQVEGGQGGDGQNGVVVQAGIGGASFFGGGGRNGCPTGMAGAAFGSGGGGSYAGAGSGGAGAGGCIVIEY